MIQKLISSFNRKPEAPPVKVHNYLVFGGDGVYPNLNVRSIAYTNSSPFDAQFQGASQVIAYYDNANKRLFVRFVGLNSFSFVELKNPEYTRELFARAQLLEALENEA